MKRINAMTEKQVEEFYDACPSGYDVEETRVFDMLSLQYVTVSMRYIQLFLTMVCYTLYKPAGGLLAGFSLLSYVPISPGIVRTVYVHRSRQKGIIQYA